VSRATRRIGKKNDCREVSLKLNESPVAVPVDVSVDVVRDRKLEMKGKWKEREGRGSEVVLGKRAGSVLELPAGLSRVGLRGNLSPSLLATGYLGHC
jgi:hypothetical protein